MTVLRLPSIQRLMRSGIETRFARKIYRLNPERPVGFSFPIPKKNMFQSQWKAPSNGNTVAQVSTVIYASAEVENQLMSPFVAESEREYLCCGALAVPLVRYTFVVITLEPRSPKSLNFHKVIAWNVEFFYVPLSRLDAAVIGCFLSRSHKHVSPFPLPLLRRNHMAFCEYNERNNHKVLS